MSGTDKDVRIGIRTEADPAGFQEAAEGARELAGATDEAAASLRAVGEQEVAPKVDTDQLDAAAESAEALGEKLDETAEAEPQVKVDTSRVEEATEKIRELLDGLSEIERAEVIVNVNSDALADLSQNADDAGKSLGGIDAWARANDLGTIISGLADTSNALKVASGLARIFGRDGKAVAVIMRSAAFATRLFNSALKANPILTVVAVLGTAVAAITAFTSKTKEATAAQDDLSKKLDATSTSAGPMASSVDEAAAAMERSKAAAADLRDRLKEVKDNSDAAKEASNKLAEAQTKLALAQIDLDEAQGKIDSKEAERRRAIRNKWNDELKLNNELAAAHEEAAAASALADEKAAIAAAAKAEADKAALAIQKQIAELAKRPEVAENLTPDGSLDIESLRRSIAERATAATFGIEGEGGGLAMLSDMQSAADKLLVKDLERLAALQKEEAQLLAVAAAKETLANTVKKVADEESARLERLQKIAEIQRQTLDVGLQAKTSEVDRAKQLEALQKQLNQAQEAGRVNVEELRAARASLAAIHKVEAANLERELALQREIAALAGNGADQKPAEDLARRNLGARQKAETEQATAAKLQREVVRLQEEGRTKARAMEAAGRSMLEIQREEVRALERELKLRGEIAKLTGEVGFDATAERERAALAAEHALELARQKPRERERKPGERIDARAIRRDLSGNIIPAGAQPESPIDALRNRPPLSDEVAPRPRPPAPGAPPTTGSASPAPVPPGMVFDTQPVEVVGKMELDGSGKDMAAATAAIEQATEQGLAEMVASVESLAETLAEQFASAVNALDAAQQKALSQIKNARTPA